MKPEAAASHQGRTTTFGRYRNQPTAIVAFIGHTDPNTLRLLAKLRGCPPHTRATAPLLLGVIDAGMAGCAPAIPVSNCVKKGLDAE